MKVIKKEKVKISHRKKKIKTILESRFWIFFQLVQISIFCCKPQCRLYKCSSETLGKQDILITLHLQYKIIYSTEITQITG